jgi:hypothetical protein
LKSLKSLSDQSLLNSLNSLVKKEQDFTCEILLHLIEVENRKIYRSLGYSSMFVYCTGGLGYSESSAQRRICAAKRPELLDEIRGKSYRQVQTIVSLFNPMIKHRDLTRAVAVRMPVEVVSESLTEGATRDKVYPARGIFIARRALRSNRDGGKSTYVGSDGKPNSRRNIMCEVPQSGRCNSTWDVEIHHDETAFALGGGHSINNLRLLCAAHNRLDAERVFGREHMDKYFKKRE